MKLKKLFDMQKQLDDRIIQEKSLTGQDLFPKLVLSLQTEIGELANEWQGFKFWKVDPQPKPKMLEEFVDCLHFILSIGNQINFKDYSNIFRGCEYFLGNIEKTSVIELLNSLMIKELYKHHYTGIDYYNYRLILKQFTVLGEKLGFTWDQIEQAYIEKNLINHQRQENGY